ncbi:MAG: LysR family transcriptional regulator [Oscillospiraceae bacterium]|nr:LysR family transcriptional regulator [Oscillospiraceae bacterium]
MNLSRIKYFLSVAEKLNFTLAAKSLYISQPALSKQIHMLETELDTQLLIRNSREVRLTKAGAFFLEELQQMRLQLELVTERTYRIGKQEQGEFRVACFNGFVSHDYLPGMIACAENVLPDQELKIVRDGFDSIRRMLKNDEADLICTMDFEIAELYEYETRDIAVRKSALIYSVRSPLANISHPNISDFAGSTLLVVSDGKTSGMEQFQRHDLRQLGLPKVPIQRLANFDTLLAYLEMGMGFALLDEEITTIRSDLLRLQLPGLENRVVAAWKKDNLLANKVINNLEL